MEQKVIVLRGAPASGKSTIAKSFRDFDKRVVWLKVDNFKDFFGDNSSRVLEYVNGSAIATLRYLLEQGFSVVMEGVFQNPRVLEEALSLSAMYEVPCLTFEFTTPLTVLLDRDKKREGVQEGLRPALPEETITTIYNTLQKTSRKDSIKIDSSQYSLEECKRIILDSFSKWDEESSVNSGAFCFFVKDNKVLMALTSYGKNKERYSGFGGGVDSDETPEEAVIREVFEEADVTVNKEDLRKVAITQRITKIIPDNSEKIFMLHFFITKKWEGELKELPGMKLEWFPFEQIPYDKMHEDNKLWMPKIFEGKLVKVDSAFVKNTHTDTLELINREIHEVSSL